MPTKWLYWGSNLGLPDHESSAISTRLPRLTFMYCNIEENYWPAPLYIVGDLQAILTYVVFMAPIQSPHALLASPTKIDDR